MENQLSTPLAADIMPDDGNICGLQNFPGYLYVLCAQVIFPAAKCHQDARAAEQLCAQARLLGTKPQYRFDQFTHGVVAKAQRRLIVADVHGK